MTGPATAAPTRFEFGIYDAAQLCPDPRTGETVTALQRLRDIQEQAELAEQVRLDVYGLAEHHRTDFAVSSPAVALAAIAARTRTIRLTGAVSDLAGADPLRLFQDFAVLDLLSAGRAEIMAGRGGADPLDPDDRVTEQIELLLQVCDRELVTWSGRHGTPLRDVGVYPRPVQQPMPVWLAVADPVAAAHAGSLAAPVALGGDAGSGPSTHGSLDVNVSELARGYRAAAAGAGHQPDTLRVALRAPTFVAPTPGQAADAFFPHYAAMRRMNGGSDGYSRQEFDAAIGPAGPLVVGDPEQVAEKIVRRYGEVGHDRFLAQLSVGSVPHHQVMRAIELFGTEVAPMVRRALGATEHP